MSNVLTDFAPSYGKSRVKSALHKIDYRQLPPNSDELSYNQFTKPQPHSAELEELVVGACLIDSTAYMRVKELLSSSDFYIREFQIVFKAIEDLQNSPSPIPIDLGTVVNRLRETDELEIVGGGYGVIKMTEKIASTANVEYHARILVQKSKKRQLIENSYWAIREAFDEQVDVFELYEAMQNKLNIQSLNPIFIGGNAEKIMKLASVAPDIKPMFGNFFKTNDLAIFFAPKKTGKTVLGYQMADAIAKGEGFFNDLVPNEAGAQKVLYCDLELNLADFKERYQNHQSLKAHKFSENLNIQILNPSNFSFEQGKMLREIEKLVVESKPKVLIIDNLTALMKSISDADSALIAIRTLLALKYKYQLSILVMCHTPKKVGNAPLLSDDILGSGILLNLATSIFGIRRSFQDKSIIYLKHCDTRNKTLIFDEENVIQMRIAKEDCFVGFHFEGCGKEANHLVKKGDESEADIYHEAIMKYTSGLSWNKVKEALGYTYTAQALQKACIRYAEKSQAFVYIHSQQKFVPWFDADKMSEKEENTEGSILIKNEVQTETDQNVLEPKLQNNFEETEVSN